MPGLDGRHGFTFAIVADRTSGHREGVFERAIGALNVLSPDFVMCIGDLIEGYTTSSDTLAAQRGEIDSVIGTLRMPFYYVAGNHDVSNSLMAGEWRKRYGPRYYHFVYKNALFLCVNTEEDSAHAGSLDSAQFRYFEQVLKDHPENSPVMVFMHKPLWTRAAAAGHWKALDSLLSSRRRYVFGGHYHNYGRAERDSGLYINLATTGGGSTLRGAAVGEFDHIVAVTVDSSRARIANLMLDGIYGDDPSPAAVSKGLRSALSAEPVTAAPLRTGRGGSDTVRFEMVNGSTVPMNIVLLFPSSALGTIAPNRIAAVLDPGEKRGSSAVITRGSAAVYVPLEYTYSVEYQVNGADGTVTPRSVVRRDGTRVVPVSMVWECRRGRAVSVDGDLREWGSLRVRGNPPSAYGFNERSYQGESDLAYWFDCRYADSMLYIGARVRDDSLVRTSDTGLQYPWFQDGIEVRIDARPDSVRDSGNGRGEGTQFLLAALCPAPTAEQTVFVKADSLAGGVKAACVSDSSGYRAEIAVPIAYLDKMQGKPWRKVRLNVTVGDFDGAPGDRGNATQLWWQPDWRSKSSFAGSGTLVKR